LEVKDLHHYDHDVDTVFKVFHDPAFITAKYQGIGARNIELLECSGEGNTYTIKVKREVPADVPGILKKFLGAWNKVEQTEEWQGETGGVRTCKLDINVIGVPVKVSGTMTLSPEGGGCVNDVRIKVTSGIPLVGSMLADFVGGDTNKSMGAEYAFIKDYLANNT
jgi:hypothetical protein